MKPKIKRVVILTHGDPAVARSAPAERWRSCRGKASRWLPPAEWDKHAEILAAQVTWRV